MAEFTYNAAKNTSASHTVFELNCGYYPRVLFQDETDPYSRFQPANELVKKLKKLMKICCQNLIYIQELQKKVYDKRVKNCSYTLNKKV